MSVFKLLLSALFVLTTFAAPQQEREGYGGKRARFRFENKVRVFEVLVPYSALISEGCRDAADGRLKCRAADALRRVDRRMAVGLDKEGGPDLGVQLCYKLGGLVLVGKDAAGNENGFCRFADDSVTDTSGILYFMYKPERKPL